MIGIYKLENKVTESKYIGASKRIEICWKDYQRYLERGVHSNTKMQEEYNTHGLNSFEFSVLEECAKEELSLRKNYWMVQFGLAEPKVQRSEISKVGSTVEIPTVSEAVIPQMVEEVAEKIEGETEALMNIGVEVDEKSLRNTAIVNALQEGKSVKDTATQFELSESMIRKIKREAGI